MRNPDGSESEMKGLRRARVRATSDRRIFAAYLFARRIRPAGRPAVRRTSVGLLPSSLIGVIGGEAMVRMRPASDVTGRPLTAYARNFSVFASQFDRALGSS